jgi:endo-1,4-beta-xylanase
MSPICVGTFAEERAPEWDMTIPSLKETFKDYFLFGNAVENIRFEDESTSDMIKYHFNTLTAENSMKPERIAGSRDGLNFAGADVFVDWSEENGMTIHGHTLVWHSQSPRWLNIAGGEPLPRAEAKANMENFITGVVSHYKGKIHSWDVVNEAFGDSVGNFTDWRDALRKNSPWYQAYANGAGEGEDASDYIYDAFVLTRLTDPGAILYYNDFNENDPNKRDAIVAMTLELNEKWRNDERNPQPERLLIEGLGLQSHYFTAQDKVQSVEDTIRAFISTGAILSVSELDVPYGSYGSYQKREEPLTEEEAQTQADFYRDLFEIYIKYSDRIERVTIWGLADPMSWRAKGYPLLFDEYFQPKKAFWSVLGTVESASPADLSDLVPEFAFSFEHTTAADLYAKNGAADNDAGAEGGSTVNGSESAAAQTVAANDGGASDSNAVLVVAIIITVCLAVVAVVVIFKKKD